MILSLHDIPLDKYSEQGIHPNYITVSYYHLLYSPEISINITRKKWYNYFGNIYEFFWDIYCNMIENATLSIYNI